MQAKINKVELRNLAFEDYKQLKNSMVESYPEMADSYWRPHQIERLLEIFPEGQLVILVDGKVVGSAMSLIINEELVDKKHNYKQIIGDYTFSTHNPQGEILYGIDVFIHPNYRGLRLGRRLYDARKELCEKLNLKGIVFAGRIPSYGQYADKMTPKKYIDKVKSKQLHDPVLSFQLSNDFHVLRIMKNYLEGDEDSKEFAVLLEWSNIYFDESPRLINTEKNVIRLGLIQWQMRSLGNLEALFEQSEFFIDVVSGYSCDFAVFPELFIAPLMADYNHMTEAEAIRELAKHSEPIRKRFQELAISYNINIISAVCHIWKMAICTMLGFYAKETELRKCIPKFT
jgi:ribosomal protein S18 acetylase RimI-like enzyme